MTKADKLLHKTDYNLAALYSRALAHCGLALSEVTSHVSTALEIYRAAGEMSRDKLGAGVAADALKQLNALAAADANDILKQVRKVATWE